MSFPVTFISLTIMYPAVRYTVLCCTPAILSAAAVVCVTRVCPAHRHQRRRGAGPAAVGPCAAARSSCRRCHRRAAERWDLEAPNAPCISAHSLRGMY